MEIKKLPYALIFSLFINQAYSQAYPQTYSQHLNCSSFLTPHSVDIQTEGKHVALTLNKENEVMVKLQGLAVDKAGKKTFYNINDENSNTGMLTIYTSSFGHGRAGGEIFYSADLTYLGQNYDFTSCHEVYPENE